MLVLDLAPLSLGLHRMSFSPEPRDVDLEPEQFDDVTVNVVLDYQKERALVMMEAQATAHLICDRTLKPFDQEVRGSYSVLFASRREATPGFEDEDSTEPYEEVRELDATDIRLDITDAVHDTLVLALPQRRIAPGAEELELETTYGAPDKDEEEAIDPRWETLRKLRSGNSDD